MDLATKHLDLLKSEQILGDFFTDNYDESDYGFVVDFNEEFLVIEKYDDECNYDGISVLMRQNISRIRWAGNDLESTAKIIGTQNRQPDIIKIDLTSIGTVLDGVNKFANHLTVHIQDLNSDVCFIGQIHEIDKTSIVIHEFGTKSSLDRKFIMLSLADITRIDAGGQYENNLKKLFNA